MIEVFDEFKLLGCFIDDKLSFKKHSSNLKTNVCRKLFAIKNIFFLSFDIKIHFFKTFLLPHFDNCASLFIYYSNTLINKLNKLYNLCLFVHCFVGENLTTRACDFERRIQKFRLYTPKRTDEFTGV